MRLVKGLVAAAGMAVAASSFAHPLHMTYSVTPNGGMFDYQFALTLDNHDNSWVSGMRWGWLIFGDAQSSNSPISDFVIDNSSFPVGPWTSLGSSSGYHNGPTFKFVLDCWQPTFVGETLTWSGSSATFLDQGKMLWSSIYSDNGTPIIEFETADLVPEPATMLGLGIAAFTLLKARKRRQR